jgi:capsular polysaccharide transport system permease protein
MQKGVAVASRHARIIGALMMREMTTRFGREGLGFAWVIGEPLLFCLGVLVLWTIIKPSYEHGLRIGPLVMTGYMCLLLLRHQIQFSLSALEANIGLLYHRRIGIMHIFFARSLLEFAGATAAFVIVYVVLLALRQVELPHDWLLLYGGWITMAWCSFGVALIFAGLAIRYDLMERLVPVLSYSMIPLSGAFFMVGWIPAQYRDAYLLVPLPHGIEMVRAAVFGEFVHTYYDPVYAWISGSVMVILGMILLAGAKNRINIE